MREVNETAASQVPVNKPGKARTFVSTDEIPGNKALENNIPISSHYPAVCAKMEFEYIRHGTYSLIGFFDCCDGPYGNAVSKLHNMHKKIDFVEA